MTIQFADLAKAKQLRDFFQQHGRIYVVVDATSDAVDVPDFLSGDPALRLALNVRMPQAIYINDDALTSNFSFSGQSHPCRIPMAYIWAAYQPDGDIEQGLIWEDSVPETIRVVVNAARALPEVPPDAPADVETDIKTEASAEATDSDATTQEKSRPVRHLRVVK